MLDLDPISNITPCDAQMLQVAIQSCNKQEIASPLDINPRTVNKHLLTLFLRAGIRDRRKRIKLATTVFAEEQVKLSNLVNG